MSVVLQHPKTEQQCLKCGSTMLLYKFFKMFCGRNCFVCFNTPMARETLHPRAFSKLDTYQPGDQDILFSLHFEYLYHVFSSLIRLIFSDAFDEIRYSWKQFNCI